MNKAIDSERFWATVDIGAEDDCWEWKASKHNRQGYGMLRVYGKKTYAHRYALLGEDCLVDKVHVLHKCDRPACCNPKHLYKGTHAQNMADRDDRLDYDRRNLLNRTLKDGEVWLIKKLLIEGRYANSYIAKMFRANRHTIKRINSGATYKEITV